MLDMQEAAGSNPAPPTNHPNHAQSDRITVPCCPGPVTKALGDRNNVKSLGVHSAGRVLDS